MAVKTLQDLISEGVAGRHILVRSDFNVPLNEAGEITDAGRITASLPTIKALSEAGAKVILMAHLGRPKGQVNPKFSLAPVAAALTDALGRYVALAGDVVGEDAHERANGLTDGDVLLLENVRFDPRETSPTRWSPSPPTTAPSCPTGSAWSTAPKPPSTMWPSASRTMPVASCKKKSTCSKR